VRKGFFRRREIGNGGTDSPPTLAPINLDEQSRVQSDVLPFHTGVGVKQTIGANYLRARIAQDRELAVRNLLEDGKGMLAVIYADGQETGVEGFEVFCVPRELAQLSGAVRSPVSTIEDQEHPRTAQRCEGYGLAMFVLQDEVWRRLAHRGRDLRPGQVLTRGKDRKQKK
jgi:hypothetical protein